MTQRLFFGSKWIELTQSEPVFRLIDLRVPSWPNSAADN